MGIWEWIVTRVLSAADAAAKDDAPHSEAATGDAAQRQSAVATGKVLGTSPDEGEVGTRGAPALPTGTSASHGEAATGKVLRGDGTWGWVAEVDGEDIVIRDATASWFGGDDDPQDSGETASGVLTKGHPDLVGFALPMDFGKSCPGTEGAPLPRLPWNTPVTVSLGDVSVTGPLIDLGPAKSAKHQVDLTQAAFRKFAPLSQGLVHGVTVRIRGAGAKVLDS